MMELLGQKKAILIQHEDLLEVLELTQQLLELVEEHQLLM
jgi:hypothetical protein